MSTIDALVDQATYHVSNFIEDIKDKKDDLVYYLSVLSPTEIHKATFDSGMVGLGIGFSLYLNSPLPGMIYWLSTAAVSIGGYVAANAMCEHQKPEDEKVLTKENVIKYLKELRAGDFKE